jgi:hypothetical protein
MAKQTLDSFFQKDSKTEIIGYQINLNNDGEKNAL